MSRLLGHLTKQKRQKWKDIRAARAVKSNVSDAARAMDSSEQTVLSLAVSWMLTAMATKWHRPADCSTREPRECPTGPPVRGVTSMFTPALWPCTFCSDRRASVCWCAIHTDARLKIFQKVFFWGGGLVFCTF